MASLAVPGTRASATRSSFILVNQTLLPSSASETIPEGAQEILDGLGLESISELEEQIEGKQKEVAAAVGPEQDARRESLREMLFLMDEYNLALNKDGTNKVPEAAQAVLDGLGLQGVEQLQQQVEASRARLAAAWGTDTEAARRESLFELQFLLDGYWNAFPRGNLKVYYTTTTSSREIRENTQQLENLFTAKKVHLRPDFTPWIPLDMIDRAKREAIYEEAESRITPLVWVDGDFLGGWKEIQEMNDNGELDEILGMETVTLLTEEEHLERLKHFKAASVEKEEPTKKKRRPSILFASEFGKFENIKKGEVLNPEKWSCEDGQEYVAPPIGDKCVNCQKGKKTHSFTETLFEVVDIKIWEGCDDYQKHPVGKICTACQKHENKHSPESRGIVEEEPEEEPEEIDYVSCELFVEPPFGDKCKTCQKSVKVHHPSTVHLTQKVQELTLEEKREATTAAAAARKKERDDAAAAELAWLNMRENEKSLIEARAEKLARIRARFAPPQ